MNREQTPRLLQKSVFPAVLALSIAIFGSLARPHTPVNAEGRHVEQEMPIAKKKKVIVLFDGWGSRQYDAKLWNPTIGRFKEKGYDVRVVHLGTDDSTLLRTMGQYEALAAEEVRKIKEDPTVEIFAGFGLSFGANVLARIAEKLEIPASVLDAPPTYPDDTLPEHMPVASILNNQEESGKLVARRFAGALDSRLTKALEKNPMHILCVYRVNDERVPFVDVYTTPCRTANQKSTVAFVKGVGHWTNPEGKERRSIDDFVLEWLENPTRFEWLNHEIEIK